MVAILGMPVSENSRSRQRGRRVGSSGQHRV
jgi:hypothetical protein